METFILYPLYCIQLSSSETRLETGVEILIAISFLYICSLYGLRGNFIGSLMWVLLLLGQGEVQSLKQDHEIGNFGLVVQVQMEKNGMKKKVKCLISNAQKKIEIHHYCIPGVASSVYV